MSDDLYIGPTTLAPGPREPSGAGEGLARLIIIPLFVLFVLIILVFFVFFTPVRVDGPSMVPTLLSEDRVLITRGAKDVQRGDVVVLVADDRGQEVELVKRVIGLPGDVVEVRGNAAYVNGVREPDRGQVSLGSESPFRRPVTVGTGQLFVMGDNRELSEDSRYIGTVPISGIKGTVVAVFAPINRVRRVD